MKMFDKANQDLAAVFQDFMMCWLGQVGSVSGTDEKLSDEEAIRSNPQLPAITKPPTWSSCSLFDSTLL